MTAPRTVPQAIEGAATGDVSKGYRFLREEAAKEAFYSFDAIERASARLGGALQALGLEKGDRVALILPDNDDFVFSFLGAIRAGLVPVPIYPPTGLGQLAGYLDNTRHIVAKSGARALVTTSAIKRLMGSVQAASPALEQVVAIDGLRESREELRPVKVSLDDVAFLQFTSGSTSRPKGVVLTHANLDANIRCIVEEGLRASSGEDVGVSWLPLFHDMGLIGFVLAALYHRIPVVFMPALMFLKRPASWLGAMSRYKGTITFGPNFAYALCVKRVRPHEIESVDLSRWRVAGCGAEPIRAETLESFTKAFAPHGFRSSAFVASYGMAESTLAVSFSEVGGGLKYDAVSAKGLVEDKSAIAPRGPEDDDLRVVACGRAFRGHDIQVFAPDDAESAHPLAERAVGELRLRGPSLMRGYFDDSELTRSAFAGGWLRTGDLGYLADGRVYVCGRLKEVVIVNGRNFYPQDLEWEAGKVEGVRKGNVIAFGTRHPHGDRERVVVAFETHVATPEARGRLASEIRMRIQESIGLTVDDVVAVAAGALPKTSSGKLQRSKARELYETGELAGRKSARDADRVEQLREMAKSQLGYLKVAVLGERKKEA